MIVTDVICIAYLTVYALGYTGYSDDFTWAIVIAGFLRMILAPRVDSLVFSFSIALIYLYLLPTVSLVSFRVANATPFLALTIPLLDAFAFAAHRLQRAVRRGRARPRAAGPHAYLIWVSLLGVCTVSGTLLPPDHLLAPVAFTIPFAVSLLYFERLLAGASLSKIYLMLAAYLGVVAIYVVFYWSGFGRLIIGAYVLMPVLIANQWREIGLRLWQAAAVAPPLLAVAMYSRQGRWFDLDELYRDSAAHHLIISAELVGSSSSSLYGGAGRFFEQWLLLFLNWVPRDFWPDKPIGLGWASVDEWYDRSLYSPGYSVSVGMYGEQIYLLGSYFLVGVAALLVTLLAVRSGIAFISRGSYAPLVAFDVSLISYVWGGGALMGTRVWFAVLPMIAIVVLWRMLAFKPRVARAPPSTDWRQAPGRTPGTQPR